MPISYRVLVVDDSDHMRVLVSKLLKTRGFQFVEMAANGKLGLEKVRTFRPQLIFLDAIMPEVNGLAVLREVKKEYPGIIVVIMTSLSAREQFTLFKEAGADLYLLKPFEPNKFDEAVNKVLAILEDHQKE